MAGFFEGRNYKFDVAGVGSALVDICLLESDLFLKSSGALKGGMKLVESSFIPKVLATSQKIPAIVPGGSACNTTLGIGKLGGISRFIGKRGNDEWGNLFETAVRRHNVEPVLFLSNSPTGHVLSIITPDAQRSMLTFLGASAETAPSEISAGLFQETALVHLEGYLLFNRELMMAALEAATEAGAKISLDLASYTVVEAALPFLRSIIANYIDIVIANEDEAFAFTGYRDDEEALAALSKETEIAVVKKGSRGSIIGHAGKVYHIDPIANGRVVDTTGAGDLWAAGFLYGLLQGYSLEKCGMLGSACGFEACRVVGATIPDEGWDRINMML